jgi:hypothetical protein
VRINTVPVEAYQQAGSQTLRKNESAAEQTDAKRPSSLEKIILPGVNGAEAESLKIPSSPSMLDGVLSSEEKTLLVRHFARFGDSLESTQIYGTNARVRAGALTGMKLDVKG